MHIRNLFFNLIVLCTTLACGEYNDGQFLYDTPQAVFVTTHYSKPYPDIPLEIVEIVKSLEFKNSDRDKKALGYEPELKIKTFKVMAYVEYDDGWLIASGGGEWGGVIFWIDRKGGYEIIRDDDLANPIDVMADGNTIFILQGMKRVSSEGHLLEISRNNSAFKKHIYPINSYPSSFKQQDGKWIIPIDYYPGNNKGHYVLSELRSGKILFHNRW